jgi:SAM-dependent methyltransferase
MHPLYNTIVSRTKNGDRVLDLGCGLGQNMRKLVLDGAPRESVFGADVSEELVKCGTEYFRDGDTPFMCFIGDILAQKEDAPNSLDMAKGQFDIVYASMFYHLWSYPTQLRASIATVTLLKPQSGSVICGWQLGASPAVEIQRNLEESRKEHTTMFRHDEGSFRELWEEVGRETASKWKVDVDFKAPPWTKSDGVEEGKSGGDTGESRNGVVVFSVTRL